jgi:hypothetical protein
MARDRRKVSPTQAVAVATLLREANWPQLWADFLAEFDLSGINSLPRARYRNACNWIRRQVRARLAA